MSKRNAEPKWMNPCGAGANVNGAASNERPPDKQLLTHIIHQATIAQSAETQFQQEFVQSTFGTDFNIHHNRFKSIHYDWLPKIPKNLNESVPKDHLESLELKQTLLDVYTSLQTIAIGLEQVIVDVNGKFKESFGRSRDNLCAVLCEIQTAIYENSLSVPKANEDIIMSQKDDTEKTFRNWIIYRDYLNMLQYIIQVFGYFNENLQD